MSYEISFVCDLCEKKTGTVTNRADAMGGKMLIVGTTNVGEVCGECEVALISGINRAREALSMRMRAPEAAPRKKTRVI